ncbi:unnamed protein product, partial [Closterium sp. Naga37s-1]
ALEGGGCAGTSLQACYCGLPQGNHLQIAARFIRSHPLKPMDLDAVVGLEEQLLAQGHAEGYQDGLRLGRQEGRETGWEHGFAIGDELGFMWGCAAAWEQVIQSVPSTRFSPRAIKAVQQLQQLISDFPISNPEDGQFDTLLAHIRARFRLSCSLMGQPHLAASLQSHPSQHTSSLEF